jgi:hypothetical protein
MDDNFNENSRDSLVPWGIDGRGGRGRRDKEILGIPLSFHMKNYVKWNGIILYEKLCQMEEAIFRITLFSILILFYFYLI